MKKLDKINTFIGRVTFFAMPILFVVLIWAKNTDIVMRLIASDILIMSFVFIMNELVKAKKKMKK